MLNLKSVAMIAVVSVVSMAASTTYALTFDDVDVEYWAGSDTGSNKAMLIIDFGDESYAFGYQWDGTATGWEMLDAVVNAGSLSVNADDYGWGHLINDFSYPGATKGTGDGWGYYIADDGENWTAPQLFGIDGRVLSDGDWDGFSWGTWTPVDPTNPMGAWEHSPVPTAPVSVPEPATMAVLAIGGVAALLKRRRTA